MATNNHIPEFVHRIRNGDVRALSRAISAVEDRRPESTALLKALFPYSGNAVLIGLTGAPGSGKSTLVDQIARVYRNRGKTVGIVAVDPSSPYSGGAILGDRIRMQSHHADPGIYIRSMATRGSLGGLASTTADVATVLDASGRDVVMIETVGVGQDEVDIVRLADVTLVVLVPGMGDDVQTIKAGIMEIADIFVINKADRDGAERVEREIRALQTITPSRAIALREEQHHRTAPGSLASSGFAGAGRSATGAMETPSAEGRDVRKDDWTPPIVKTIASEGTGIEELVEAIESYRAYLQQSDRARARRIENWRERIAEMLRDALFQRVLAYYLSEGEAARYAAEVAEHKRDPYSLVEEIVDELGKPE
ncbi:MAG TPA: methylmalonyl Co-A mutase-associated GTPase MeaB [Terriglobales bacterium]|nr:methylmalonyl Co-A mutase-associated GTPase MeaB [Terriglobales bacterium]